MTKVLLQCKATTNEGPCALCQRPIRISAGHQLCLTDSDDPICVDCGRTHAPELTALIRLADSAGRVGRIGFYGVCPPMLALLDLARAAEDYTRTTTPARRAA